jgi:hypothetical protein
MKRGALLIALMLGAAGCAPVMATQTVTAPDGRPATSIQCGREARCLAEAQRVCPGGYYVLDAEAMHVEHSRGGAPMYGGRMLIRCQ